MLRKSRNSEYLYFVESVTAYLPECRCFSSNMPQLSVKKEEIDERNDIAT